MKLYRSIDTTVVRVTTMEKILSPEKLAIANRHWADTLMQACGAKPGDTLDDHQTAALTKFVLHQLFRMPLPVYSPATSGKVPGHPLFPGVHVPTKRRGSPATMAASPAAKKPKIEEPKKIENVERQRKPPAAQGRNSEEVVTVLPLPARFREAMAGMGLQDEDKIKFLVQKVVTGTDVGKTQNRLQIPATKIKAEGFLTAEEEKMVDTAEGMVVPVVEPSGREVCELRLRLWRMSNNKYYALVNRNRPPDDSAHKWHSLVTRNRIQKDDTVQVWSFRVGPESRLCLALVKV